jgi:cell division protein FtsB
MRYWGTEDNVSRSGKTARGARRQRAGRSERGTRASGQPSKRSGGDSQRRSGGQTEGRQTIAAGGSVKNYPFLRQFYRHQTAIGDRLQRVLFFLMIAAFIYVFVLGDSGAIKIVQLRLERARLDDNIAELQHNSAQLEATIARLKTDDFYIEKIGREKFGYARPSDRVYKIIPIDDREYY